METDSGRKHDESLVTKFPLNVNNFLSKCVKHVFKLHIEEVAKNKKGTHFKRYPFAFDAFSVWRQRAL